MSTPETPRVPDHSLVRWRRTTDSDYLLGIVRDGHVWSLAHVPEVAGDVIRASLFANEFGPEDLFVLASDNDQAEPVALEQVELGPPVPKPGKILCLGLNYRDHAAGSGFEVPTTPVIFAKFANGLVGANANIVIPKVSTDIDYEGELAVVIGRKAKNVAEVDALAYVAGYSVFNDVTARDIQLRTSQWTSGKAIDTFAPMGPGLVPAATIADPQALTLTTTLNGEVTQHDSTGSMVFKIAETIAYISTLMTLEPGDIIATGTPAGVVFEKEVKRWLVAGDVLEVTISGLGTLRNPVAAEIGQADTLTIDDESNGRGTSEAHRTPDPVGGPSYA